MYDYIYISIRVLQYCTVLYSFNVIKKRTTVLYTTLLKLFKCHSENKRSTCLNNVLYIPVHNISNSTLLFREFTASIIDKENYHMLNIQYNTIVCVSVWKLLKQNSKLSCEYIPEHKIWKDSINFVFDSINNINYLH